MSVLIPGMEMPKSCAACPCANDEARFCKAANEYIPMMGHPKFCPLVPVPEHGRLIDADALLTGTTNLHVAVVAGWLYVRKSTIEDAPTVIPADPPVMYYPQVPGITPTVIAEEVYDEYTDTAGNHHWKCVLSGEHIIPADKEGEG